MELITDKDGVTRGVVTEFDDRNDIVFHMLRWIPVTERLPDDGRYVLISFENYTNPDIGRYEIDENGNGTFYPGDEDEPYDKFGLIVNAWMKLPEPYREEQE